MGHIPLYNVATTKTRRAQIMKTATINKKDYPFAPYPNAATRREVIHKVLDFFLVLASCAGIAAALLLLFAMA